MTVSLFTITPTPPTSIALAGGGQGKFSFTITCLAAPDQHYDLILQALLIGADGKTSEVDWLVPGPAPTLSMTGGETKTVAILVRPTTTPVGRYNLKLAVADKARPNDTFTYSAPVVCEISSSAPPQPQHKKFPWWIVAIAGGVVVLAGAGILIWKLTSHGGGTATGDAGRPPTADGPPPSGFAPLHVQSVLPGAQDLVLGGSPVTIDTSAHTINGAESRFFVQQGDSAVLFASAFSLQSPLVITGQSPLIIVATDQVTITASITLKASGATSGPGAAPAGHPGAGGAGGTAMAGGARVCSGGAGGSHGSLGAPGGSNLSSVPPGAVGAPYGGRPADPLLGGAPGGNGGFGANTEGWGKGGGGGGALQISSAVSISVSATIDAGGGGGVGGRSGEVGGGGGGAGGEILLEAPAIRISGTLAANGGGGGGGGGTSGTPLTDGSNGPPGPGPASGGSGATPQGAAGGAGGAGGAGAQPGSNLAPHAGGGGGGGGRIWLRHRAAMPPVTSGARISPPASLDPTLP